MNKKEYGIVKVEENMVYTREMISEGLNRKVIFSLVLPKDKQVNQLVIFLHGKMDSKSAVEKLEEMVLDFELEKLCEQYQVAVAIPFMENRYYISTKDCNCDAYIAQEFPKYIKETYGIAKSVELVLAGVSMGGFGATLIAARTGAFQKIISISGAYIAKDIAIGNSAVWGSLTPASRELKNTFLHYFLPLSDLMDSIERNALEAVKLFEERSESPFFVITCGTEDWLYSRNMEFVNILDEMKIGYRFFAIKGEGHEANCFKTGLWKSIEYAK